MSYSTILIATLRLVFVFVIGTGLVRILAILATLVVTRASVFSWEYLGSPFLQVAAGILLFFLAPALARIAVGRRDGEIAPPGTTPHGVVRAGIVGVGIYLVATHLPLVINGIHHFTTPERRALPWSPGAQASLYDLFQPLGGLALGFVYVLANGCLAKPLCPKGKREEPPAG